MIYADHNATSPLREEARDAMLCAMDAGANPSSIHGAGRAARKLLEDARTQIGGAIGAAAQDIIFTSGGTEANALAITGCVTALNRKVTLFNTEIEHPAVRECVARLDVPQEIVPVTSAGVIDLGWLETRLGERAEADGMPLLALMLANNETGVIQPVAEAAAMMRSAGGLTHCDVVQGLGKIPVNTALLGADTLALSAHKIGGPAGAGALWLRPGTPLKPLQVGGGQERSLRSGTENLIGIAGFGAAAEAAVRDLDKFAELAKLRDRLESTLKKQAGITVFGETAPRLANTSCFALTGFASETQVIAMDLAGIAISSGAACSSGKVKSSGVLTAMGVKDALASSAVRISLGWDSVSGDIDAILEAWLAAARRTVLKESA